MRPTQILSTPESIEMTNTEVISINNFDFFYSQVQALFSINLSVYENSVMALIGPSGCGKSTLLRSINRMNDLVDGARVQGKLTVNGNDIYSKGCDVISLRRDIGMVFQKSNPFPKSIYENTCYGLRIAGISDKKFIEQSVEQSLRDAGLWDGLIRWPATKIM